MEVDELWDFVMEHKLSVAEDPYLIASIEPNTDIYIGFDDDEGKLDEDPCLIVCVDGDEIERIWCFDEEDMLSSLNDIYDAYGIDAEQEIREREIELYSSVEDMLMGILDADSDISPELVDGVLNITLAFIADRYPDIRIYRPAMIKGEDGRETYVEYPYEK